MTTNYNLNLIYSLIGQPPAFLQCGDFVYPLVPGQSPVLRSSHMAYVFPDVQTEGHSVGIMFNALPKHELQQLNQVCHQYYITMITIHC